METQVKTEVGVNNGIDLREAFKQTLTSIVKQYIGIDTELPPDYAVNDDDLDLFSKIQNENPSMSVFEVMEDCIRIDHVTKRFMSEGYCIFGGVVYFSSQHEAQAVAYVNEQLGKNYENFAQIYDDSENGKIDECYYTEWH